MLPARQTFDVYDYKSYESAVQTINAQSNSSFTINLISDLNMGYNDSPAISHNIVTIIGNGHSIYGGLNHTVSIKGDAVVYLGDGNSKLTFHGSSGTQSELISLSEKAVVTMYSGVTLRDNISLNTPSAVDIIGDAVFNMAGGVIDNCSRDTTYRNRGGAIQIDGNPLDELRGHPTLNISGGTIKNCSAYGGGALYAEDGANVNISGVTIKNCNGKGDAGSYGGGIYFDGSNGGTLTIRDSTIKNCNVDGHFGGGIFVFKGSDYNFSGLTVTDCSASSFGGGGLSFYNVGNATLSDAFIAKNSAPYGGGVFFVGNKLDASGKNTICNNFASAAGSDVLVYSGSVSLPKAKQMDENYQQTGRKINGWFEDYTPRYSYPDNTTREVNAGENLSGFNGWIAALQEASEYTLNYDANGGNGAPASETKSGSGSTDFTVSAIEPTREGYRFLGWADTNDARTGQYQANDSVPVSDADVGGTKTLYAVWASNDDYILDFDANGGTGAPATQYQPSEEAGNSASFIIPEKIPVREGFTFLGWSHNNENKEVHFAKGDTITLSGATTGKAKTLYAVWIPNDTAEKKKDVPSVEKKVWNIANNAWQDTAFAGVNGYTSDAALAFKITGTMPANLEGYMEDQKTETAEEENDKNTWSQENETNSAEETEPSAAETQNESSGTDTKKTPIYSSYTDYKFTDTYEAGITPDLSSLHVYLYNNDTSSEPAAGMTGNSAGDEAVDITELFDVVQDESNRRIEVNLKKSGVAATDGTTGAVDLKKSYILNGNSVAFHANSKIVVYFNATLNSDAAVGPTGNANMATLEFRNAKGEYLTEYTPPDTVRVFTFKLQVKKWKDAVGSEALPGAVFTLYKGNKSSENVVATGTSDTNGIVELSNLTTISTGTYILEETTAPAGYNRMPDARITISGITEDPAADPKLTSVSVRLEGNNVTGNISDDSTQVNIDVVNKAGLILPSTGGIGTTIFYVVGTCLIAVALVILIVKRKK